jgi:hypothetical protein
VAQRKAHGALALRRVRNTGIVALKCVQEVDQIGFLLVGEAYSEPLIIEVNDIQEGRR